jgi:hypothetical protein
MGDSHWPKINSFQLTALGCGVASRADREPGLPTPAEPERVAPASALVEVGRFHAWVHQNGVGNSAVSDSSARSHVVISARAAGVAARRPNASTAAPRAIVRLAIGPHLWLGLGVPRAFWVHCLSGDRTPRPLAQGERLPAVNGRLRAGKWPIHRAYSGNGKVSLAHA